MGGRLEGWQQARPSKRSSFETRLKALLRMIAFIGDRSGKITGAVLNPGPREIKGVKIVRPYGSVVGWAKSPASANDKVHWSRATLPTLQVIVFDRNPR